MTFDLLGLFAAGLATFASPCILPLAPVYLGLVGGASIGELRAGRRIARTLAAATAFTLGLGVVFVLLGLAATSLGHALVAHRTLLLQLGGLAIFLFGLKYLGVLQLPFLDQEFRPGMERAKGGSIPGAFVMGAAFGLGWTPCIGPVLGSVLTFTATSATQTTQGALYLAVYAAGLGLPLIAAAAVAPLALGALQKAQRYLRPMQLATGGLLAIVGLLVLTDNVGLLDPTRLFKGEEAAHPAPVAFVDPAASSGVSGTCGGGADAGACALPTEVVADAPEQQFPEGPVMVEFVGRHCPVCLRMAPIVGAMKRECLGQGVKIHRIEVDAPGGRELARRHGVLGVPTFLFIDADGREVARMVGEQPHESLAQSLQVLSGGKCSGFRAFPG